MGIIGKKEASNCKASKNIILSSQHLFNAGTNIKTGPLVDHMVSASRG